jgi:hypothetical protein
MYMLEKPEYRANAIGTIEPRTEAHPFTAQAQARKEPPDPACIRTPMGNGIPIKKPSGKTMRNADRSRAAKGNPSANWITG